MIFMWYDTHVQIVCIYVVQKNFCVVYVFAVAQSTHVDDSSHVYAHYFFYMSCIFSSFLISFLHRWFTLKEFISNYVLLLFMINYDRFWYRQRNSHKKMCILYHESMIWWKHDVLYMFVAAKTTKFYHLHAM